MHLHVVGRFENDPYWPAPVWGNIQSKSYTQQKNNLLEKLEKYFKFYEYLDKLLKYKILVLY